MIIYDVKSCDYCKSTIAAGQRWVREKTYDPRSNGQVPVYHHYHAELFGGQEGSCWEKHQIDSEIAQTALTTAKWEAVRSESRGRLQVIKL
jgi:hypothetical protein